MEIEHSKKDNVLIVRIMNSRLDAQEADDFRNIMSGFISDGYRCITLDISEVAFIDSSGLGAMVSVLKMMGEEGDIAICGATESAMRMFKLTRMNKVFRIFEKEDDAVHALSKERPCHVAI
jgi:anti-sigma B factor antagonist